MKELEPSLTDDQREEFIFLLVEGLIRTGAEPDPADPVRPVETSPASVFELLRLTAEPN